MKPKKKVVKDFSCGGLVWDTIAHKVLLVQVENLAGEKVWTFPKGHPEGKETDQLAAAREVREETGWLATCVKPLMDVRYFYTHKGTTYNKTVRWFLMRPVQKAGDFDPEEIVACQWADLKEVETLISYDSDKKLLKKLKTCV